MTYDEANEEVLKSMQDETKEQMRICDKLHRHETLSLEEVSVALLMISGAIGCHSESIKRIT